MYYNKANTLTRACMCYNKACTLSNTYTHKSVYVLQESNTLDRACTTIRRKLKRACTTIKRKLKRACTTIKRKLKVHVLQ